MKITPALKVRWYLLVLLVVSAIGGCYFWYSYHQNLAASTAAWNAAVQQPVATNSIASNKFFNPAEIKVGYVVAGMPVTETGRVREDLPQSFNPFFKGSYDPAKPVMNYKISFQGSRIVDGVADPSRDSKGNFNGWRLYVSLSSYLPLDQDLIDPQQSAFSIHIYGDSSLLPTDRSSDVTVDLQNFQIRAYVDENFTDAYSADIKNIISFTPNPLPDPNAHD